MSLQHALAAPPRGAVVGVIAAWTAALHVAQLLLVAATATPTRLTPVVISLLVWVGVTAWGALPRRMHRPEAAVAMAVGAAAITVNALWSGTPGVRELASVGMVGYVLAVGALSRGRCVLWSDAVILVCQALVVGAQVGASTFGVFAITATVVTTGGACLAVWSLQTTLRQLLASNREAATRDHLTGLLNRRGMDLGFSRLRACAPDGNRLAAVVFDLDRFKDVNDVHGHAVGDEVLQRVAAVLRAHSRTDDLVVRLGGEELAWLAAWPGAQEALEAADAVRRDVAAAPTPHGAPVTTSAGVAFGTDETRGASDDDVLSRLLVRADTALYEAKRTGRDRVVVAESPPPAVAASRHAGAPAPQVRDGGSGRAGAEAQRA